MAQHYLNPKAGGGLAIAFNGNNLDIWIEPTNITDVTSMVAADSLAIFVSGVAKEITLTNLTSMLNTVGKLAKLDITNIFTGLVKFTGNTKVFQIGDTGSYQPSIFFSGATDFWRIFEFTDAASAHALTFTPMGSNKLVQFTDTTYTNIFIIDPAVGDIWAKGRLSLGPNGDGRMIIDTTTTAGVTDINSQGWGRTLRIFTVQTGGTSNTDQIKLVPDGSLVFGPNVVKRAFKKTGITAVGTDLFRVDTPSGQGGSYHVNVHWQLNRQSAACAAGIGRVDTFSVGNKNDGSMMYSGGVVSTNSAAGTGNGATMGSPTVTSAINTVAANQNKLTITPNWNGGTDTTTTGDLIAFVELTYTGYTTAPTIVPL